MISPDFSTLLETDVVRVLGPEMVNVSKSSRSWKKKDEGTSKLILLLQLNNSLKSTYLADVVIGRTNVNLKENIVIMI